MMSTLNHDDLQQAVVTAQTRFALLREEFPTMRAYLVFALEGQQAAISSPPHILLKTLPKMVVEGQAAEALQLHMKMEPEKDGKQSAKDEWQKTTNRLGLALHYHGHARVEIRFSHLDFAIIDRLRGHQLIDQTLTPQTRASIRIVLGSLDGMRNSGKPLQ